MTLLLDTHILLWMTAEPDSLGGSIREAIESGEEALAYSPISVWEMMMLHERGRISLGDVPRDTIAWMLREVPIRELPITHDVAIRSRLLDLPHQDPADRFLAATAVEYRAVLATHDHALIASEHVQTLGP